MHKRQHPGRGSLNFPSGSNRREVILLLLAGLLVPTAANAVQRHYLTLQATRLPAESSQRDHYLQGVRSRIEENRRYPLAARKQGMEGRVAVRFVIAQDGGLQEVELEESCGASNLDEAALAAVRRAAPFAAPPAGLFPGQAVMRIVIAFSLE